MQKEDIMSSRPRAQSSVMRSSRTRNFIGIAIICAFLFVLYLLSDANQKWGAFQYEAEKCHQRRDSLAAQLQVTFEHKGRLDKALQEEKSQHLKVKEDFSSYKQMQQSAREHDQQESIVEIGNLQKQLTAFQNQNSDLISENNKLNNKNIELINEAKNIENDYKTQIQQRELTMKSLNSEIQSLSSERVRLINKITELKGLLQARGHHVPIGADLQQKSEVPHDTIHKLNGSKLTSVKSSFDKNNQIKIPNVAGPPFVKKNPGNEQETSNPIPNAAKDVNNPIEDSYINKLALSNKNPAVQKAQLDNLSNDVSNNFGMNANLPNQMVKKESVVGLNEIPKETDVENNQIQGLANENDPYHNELRNDVDKKFTIDSGVPVNKINNVAPLALNKVTDEKEFNKEQIAQPNVDKDNDEAEYDDDDRRIVKDEDYGQNHDAEEMHDERYRKFKEWNQKAEEHVENDVEDPNNPSNKDEMDIHRERIDGIRAVPN